MDNATTLLSNFIHRGRELWAQGRSTRRLWMILMLVFTAETLLFTYIYYEQVTDPSYTPPKIPAGWTLNEFFIRQFIWLEMMRRVPWAFYGLLVVWLARTYPIAGSMKWRNLALHLMCLIVLSILHGVVVLWAGKRIVPTFPSLLSPYLRGFGGIFLGCVNYAVLALWAHLEAYRRQYEAASVRSAKLETDLAQSQLHALKMQLQPHFLFNALNSISALLYEDAERADEMIARLGDLLRMTLDNPSSQFVPLQQELDLLQCYVDIEMLRFPRRLHVEMQIESGLQDAEVPNLLLQPLVENAVKYGVLQHASGGRIVITARRLPSNPAFLEITVRDNGPGMRHDEVQRSNGGRLTKKSSIGIHTTQERLRKLYGEGKSAEGGYQFSTYNAPEGGFVVHIELPLRFMKGKNTEAQKAHQTLQKKEITP